MYIKAVFFDVLSLLANDKPPVKDFFKLHECVPKLLSKIKDEGVKLVLVSNNLFRNKKSLKELGIIHYFDLIIFEFKFGRSNELFLQEALQLLKDGIGSGQVIYVSEDFKPDIKLAIGAGMWGLWINRDQEKKEITFGWQVSSIKEVLNVLKGNIQEIDKSSLC